MMIDRRLKRGIAVSLILAMLFTLVSFPLRADASSANYSIANDFMKYSINSKQVVFD